MSFVSGLLQPAWLLGTDGVTKTDEFSEKFQTAFDPPPPSLSENYIADFCHYKRFFGHEFRQKTAI